MSESMGVTQVSAKDALAAHNAFSSLGRIESEVKGKKYVCFTKTEGGFYKLREYSSKLGLLWDKFLRALNIRKGDLYAGESGMMRLKSELTTVIAPVLTNVESYYVNLTAIKAAHVGLQLLCKYTEKGAIIFKPLTQSMEDKIRNMEAIKELVPNTPPAREIQGKISTIYGQLFGLPDNENAISALQNILTNPYDLLEAWKTCDRRVTEYNELQSKIAQETGALAQLTGQHDKASKEYGRLSKGQQEREDYLEKAPEVLSRARSSLESTKREMGELLDEIGSVGKQIEHIDVQIERQKQLSELEDALRGLVMQKRDFSMEYDAKKGKKDKERIKGQLEAINDQIRIVGSEIGKIQKASKQEVTLQEQYRNLHARLAELSDDYAFKQEHADKCEKQIEQNEKLLPQTEKRHAEVVQEMTVKRVEIQSITKEIDRCKGVVKDLHGAFERWQEHSPLTVDELKTQQENIGDLLKLQGAKLPTANSFGRIGESDNFTLSKGVMSQIIQAMANKEGFSRDLKQAMHDENAAHRPDLNLLVQSAFV